MRAAVLVALACACGRSSAPTYRTTVGPNGNPVAIIDCRNDPGGCYVLAGKICPRGYDVLMSSDREGFEGRAAAGEQIAIARAETFTAKTIMVGCRAR